MRRLLPVAAVWLLAIVSAAGQGAPAPAAPMAETVFKNVQVLKGIPVDEFMDTMGMFSAALGYDCASCHAPEIRNDRAAFAITTPAIQRARMMVLMMNGINRQNFGGEMRVSCFTCHRGQIRPEIVPSLALQYGALIEDPSAMAIVPDRSASVDEVFTKYYQALGGSDALAALTSIVATGTYEGFNTGGGAVPIEIYAAAPDRRTQIVTINGGRGVKTYDGRQAWAAEEWRPLPLLPLTGGNLAGARLEALLTFPAAIRPAFSSWQVSSTIIDDEPVQILQGSNSGELPVNFYFGEDGLLMRVVRWNRTAVGTVPTQIDLSDYRDVASVKIPHRVMVTWTDGQNTTTLREVRANVRIDPARFARPAPYARPEP